MTALQKISESWIQKVYDSLQEGQRDWVGLYWRESFLDSSKPNSQDLLVGYYIGPETPHTRIPISEGLCGLAVREEKTINVQDVREDSRFLACSTLTRSEIIIPIRNSIGEVIGELDIDSNKVNGFDAKTQKSLEALVNELEYKLASTIKEKI